jgi:hypothetical protein
MLGDAGQKKEIALKPLSLYAGYLVELLKALSYIIAEFHPFVNSVGEDINLYAYNLENFA